MGSIYACYSIAPVYFAISDAVVHGTQWNWVIFQADPETINIAAVNYLCL